MWGWRRRATAPTRRGWRSAPSGPGLRVPALTSAATVQHALAAAHALRGPWVVKPADNQLGRGVVHEAPTQENRSAGDRGLGLPGIHGAGDGGACYRVDPGYRCASSGQRHAPQSRAALRGLHADLGGGPAALARGVTKFARAPLGGMECRRSEALYLKSVMPMPESSRNIQRPARRGGRTVAARPTSVVA